MTTLTNREKNILHEARQDAKVRPSAQVFNYEELQRVMHNWILATRQGGEQYSPFETVNS